MTFSIADFFNRLTSSDTHSSVLPEDSLLKMYGHNPDFPPEKSTLCR